MLFLYNLLSIFAMPALRIAATFSPKLKQFVSGRKTVFETLAKNLKPGDTTIWFHSASLGEYEQGLPVMERLRVLYPKHKIILTFFSPSGYEIRKNTKAADVVVYLPIDTKNNARKFVELVNPVMAFFIKYEFWPNYLEELAKQNVPTYLISGIFRQDQAFFKWYGGSYRKALTAFEHFFVQNESSKQLLQQLGFQNITVSGDTRYDRVSGILERDNSLPFIEEFIDGQITLVFGSSWPNDEAMFIDFINASSEVKYIIAPHEISADHIKAIKGGITKKTVLFSEKEGKDLSGYEVLIVDTIGILSKIYSYADVAYVGGGFGTAGLHNILEPAAFSVPLVIGPNHQKFPEAAAMIHMGGCIEVKNKKGLEDTFLSLIHNDDYRRETGHAAGTFVRMNRGAVDVIIRKLTAVE